MTCDVVIVSFCSSAQLPGCLTAVEKNTKDLETCRIFVVDNASSDASVACVHDSFPSVTVIENTENIGYGAAINRALEESRTEYVLCLNPDVRLQARAIVALVECMERHTDAIAVAPKMTYPDGSFHAVCRRFPSLWRNFCHVTGLAARLPKESAARHWLAESQHENERDVDMVSGACVLLKRDYLDRVDRFDENIFLYEEEADIFLPSRTLGGRAYFCPSAEATHEHGASVDADTKANDAPFHRLRSKYFVFRKHFGVATARLVYQTDRCIFGASVVRHIFTKHYEAKRAQYELARTAYESSKSHEH